MREAVPAHLSVVYPDCTVTPAPVGLGIHVTASENLLDLRKNMFAPVLCWLVQIDDVKHILIESVSTCIWFTFLVFNRRT